jgi:hypothetical protein
VPGISARRDTLAGIADALNARGVPAARGGRWHVSTVVNLLRRSAQQANGPFLIGNKRLARQLQGIPHPGRDIQRRHGLYPFLAGIFIRYPRTVTMTTKATISTARLEPPEAGGERGIKGCLLPALTPTTGGCQDSRG